VVILEKVDSIMGKMVIKPLSDIQEELSKADLLRLAAMKYDSKSCLQIFTIWERIYKRGERDATILVPHLQKVLSCLVFTSQCTRDDRKSIFY
jgi:hypothetical protein